MLHFTFCLCPGTLPKHQQRLNHRIQKGGHELLVDSNQSRAKGGQRPSRQRPWTQYPSRPYQQSIGNTTEATPLLGFQPPKWLQQGQSWRKLPKRHSFVCGAGVFQTQLPARPSLKWSEFHPWLFFRRKADQPDFCYRILCRNCQIDRMFKIFGFT